MQKDFSRITGDNIWMPLMTAQSFLEKFGAADMEKNLPVLYTMYLFAVRTLLGAKEDTVDRLQREYRDNLQNLQEECLLSPEQVTAMTAAADASADILNGELEKEKAQEKPNPIRALVIGTTDQLGVNRADVNKWLAGNLTDFLIDCGIDAKTLPRKKLV